MYVMLGTRSDLAFVVGLISRYLSNPSLLYWQVVKRNLSYIKGTLKHHMYYQRSNNMQLHRIQMPITPVTWKRKSPRLVVMFSHFVGMFPGVVRNRPR